MDAIQTPDKQQTPDRQYSEGWREALVCDNNHDTAKAIVTALTELNFNTQMPADVEDTYEKLKYTRFDCIVLNEGFGGETPENNEVLDYLRTIPISNRRHTFLILLSRSLKTNDNMKAFFMSVNQIINIEDLRNIKRIIKKGIAEGDNFYMVYKDILKKTGKL